MLKLHKLRLVLLGLAGELLLVKEVLLRELALNLLNCELELLVLSHDLCILLL